MKAASKIFRIFVVGVAIMSSLLVSLPRVYAAIQTYHGYYKANQYWYETNTNGIPVSKFYDLTIVCDSEEAEGTVTVSPLGTFHYSGLVTYYSGISYNNSGAAISYSGSFTGTYNESAVITELDSNQLQSIVSAINQVNTTDQAIITALNSMKSDIMGILNNLDNIIDTISWVDINSTFNGFSDELNGTYTIPDSSGSLSPLYVSFQNPNIIYDQSAIYKVTIPYTIVKSRTGKMTLYVADNEVDADFYWYNNARKLEIYIYNIYSSSNLRNVKIKIESLAANKNVIYYPYSTYEFKVEMITSNDIEYWTLLTYLEQNNVNDELSDQNDNLSNSVDNYVQTEDNLIDDFDSSISNPDVDPLNLPNSNPGNWGTGFTGSLGLIGHVFNMLTASATGGNAVYLLMNFSLMLGLALLIIGKRG